ncbi:MAG: hypothetical protein ACRD0L_01730 [Acidimicrobiales bacterium]
MIRGHAYWATPGDLWATVRDAHYVGWGYFGGIYGAGTALVTFPGYFVLLAPVVMLTGALGLTEGFPFYPPHPTAWLVIGPFTMLTNGVALFALDKLAGRLGVGRRGRWVLSAGAMVALWPSTALWGHPEDVLALALGVYALVAVIDRRWRACGWLFGAALACQPLTILIFPVAMAVAFRERGWRSLAPLVGRAAALPAFLLAVVLTADFHDAWRALTRQPNFPKLDWPTPWMALSPHLGHDTVAAGPGRMIAVVAAIGIGVWLATRRRDPLTLVWAAGLAMAGRCVFESVMVPYYVAPAVVLLLVASWHQPLWRRGMAVVAGVLVTVMTFWHLGPWLYWGSMVALLAVEAGAAWPGPARSGAGRRAEAVTDLSSAEAEEAEAAPSEPPVPALA